MEAKFLYTALRSHSSVPLEWQDLGDSSTGSNPVQNKQKTVLPHHLREQPKTPQMQQPRGRVSAWMAGHPWTAGPVAGGGSRSAGGAMSPPKPALLNTKGTDLKTARKNVVSLNCRTPRASFCKGEKNALGQHSGQAPMPWHFLQPCFPNNASCMQGFLCFAYPSDT